MLQELMMIMLNSLLQKTEIWLRVSICTAGLRAQRQISLEVQRAVQNIRNCVPQSSCKLWYLKERDGKNQQIVETDDFE